MGPWQGSRGFSLKRKVDEDQHLQAHCDSLIGYSKRILRMLRAARTKHATRQYFSVDVYEFAKLT